MQLREDCDLDPDGRQGDGQKLYNSEYIFILKLTGFAGSFDVRYKRNGGVRNES